MVPSEIPNNSRVVASLVLSVVDSAVPLQMTDNQYYVLHVSPMICCLHLFDLQCFHSLQFGRIGSWKNHTDLLYRASRHELLAGVTMASPIPHRVSVEIDVFCFFEIHFPVEL